MLFIKAGADSSNERWMNNEYKIRVTHFSSSLPLDAVSAAREAELVVRLRGALHEVRVLQAFLAERALERRGGRGGGRGRRLRAGQGGPPLPGSGGPRRSLPCGAHCLRGRHRGGGGHVARPRRAASTRRARCGEMFWNQGHCLISDILHQNRTNIYLRLLQHSKTEQVSFWLGPHNPTSLDTQMKPLCGENGCDLGYNNYSSVSNAYSIMYNPPKNRLNISDQLEKVPA